MRELDTVVYPDGADIVVHAASPTVDAFSLAVLNRSPRIVVVPTTSNAVAGAVVLMPNIAERSITHVIVS